MEALLFGQHKWYSDTLRFEEQVILPWNVSKNYCPIFRQFSFCSQNEGQTKK